MWASPRHTTLLHLGSTEHYVCFLRHGLIGMHERDVSFYCGCLTALPVRDQPQDVRYGHDDILFFKSGFVDRADVDASVDNEGDLSLKAEIHRYRCTCTEVVRLQQKIDTLHGQKYMAISVRDRAVCWLEDAGSMRHIEEQTQRRHEAAVWQYGVL